MTLLKRPVLSKIASFGMQLETATEGDVSDAAFGLARQELGRPAQRNVR